MKQSPLLLLCVGLLLSAKTLLAQTDSLYAQQWNRDPVLSLNHTASAQRQIITAKQIQATGYTRLSDVLQLIDGWTYTTLTGDKWALQSNGTGSYKNQNWMLMLNGQRIEMNRSEAIDINKLGVSVADIDRIEIMNSTGMYLGEFAQNGLIQIVTKKNPEGLSSRTFYGQTFSPDNTEQLRYNIYQTLGYSHKKFHMHATLGVPQNPTGATFVVNPATQTSSSPNIHLETQYSGNKITHQFQAGLSTNASSRAENNYQRVGYLGSYDITKHQQIRLSTSFNKDGLLNQDAHQINNTINHRFVKQYKNGNFIWQNGIGYDYLKISGITALQAHIIKPFSSINFPITRKINIFSDAQFAIAKQKVAPKIALGLYKRVSFISNYSFLLSYNEHLLEQFLLNTINQHILSVNNVSYFYNPKQVTADFYYNINFGNSVKLSVNSGLKNTFDLPDYSYVLTQYVYGYYTSERIKRSTTQLNWINRVNVHYDIVKNMVVDVNYMRTGMVDSWNDNLQNTPKHKFSLTLQYDLPKRFSLWTRNYWQSETKWWNEPSFFNSNPTGDLYYTLPSTYTWDLGINKKLLKEYLIVNLSARNLFNGNEQYLPIGSQFDTRFSASITANIDGIFASRAAKP